MRKLIFNPMSGLASVAGGYFLLQYFWRPETALGVLGFLAVLGMAATVIMVAVAFNTEMPSSAGGTTPTGFAAVVGMLFFFPTMIAISGAVGGFAAAFFASTDLALKVASASIAGFALWGMVVLPKT